MNMRKKRQTEAAIEEGLKKEQDSGPSRDPDRALWEGARQFLDEAVQTLAGPYREALILHYLQGKTVAETAAATGVGGPTAYKRIERARDQLRQRLSRRLAIAPGVMLMGLQEEGTVTIPAGLAEGCVRRAIENIGGAGGATTDAAGQAMKSLSSMGRRAVVQKLAIVLIVMAVGSAGVYGIKRLVSGAGDTPSIRPLAATPAAATRYVDGPVVFRDDFERPIERALENWGIVLWAKDTATGTITTRVPTPEMLTRFLDVGPENVGGNTSQTVKLDFDALHGKFPEIVTALVHMNFGIRELAEKGPVSIGYDLWLAPGSEIGLLMGKEYGGGSVTAPTLTPRTMDAPERTGEQRYRSERIDIFPRTGSAGRRSFEFRHFIDGKMVQQQVRDFEDFFIGCGLSKGKARLDNYVVRRMIPAQDRDK